MRSVLVGDDHAVTRRGLIDLIRELTPDVEVVEAETGDAVLAALPRHAWDLIVLDVVMPGLGIIDVIRKIRESLPNVPILVLTGSDEIAYVIETLKAGANGVVHKHRATEELQRAVEQVSIGKTYMHAETAAAIARSVQPRLADVPHGSLSEREMEIFRKIALGFTIKEIGFDLALSDKTVATYLARIREKTGLVSHVDIARYAIKHRLVD